MPAADESFEIPKRGERIDVNNPHQLEFRRRSLASDIEGLEEDNLSPDVKVKLELCRRQLWNDDIMKAIKAAKVGGRDAGDAHQRVDEALREVTEKLEELQEKEKENILPNEWRKECRQADRMLATEWATTQDREAHEAIQQQGESALQRKRWKALQESIRELGHLGFVVQQRDPEFWRNVADSLPTEAECYADPEEAQAALARLSRPLSLEELRADVVRLVRMLPNPRGVAGYVASGIVG